MNPSTILRGAVFEALAVLGIASGVLGCGGAHDAPTNADQVSSGASAAIPLTINKWKGTLAIGGVHVCAVAADHTLKCWGDDNYGQLGVDPGSLPGVTIGVGVFQGTTNGSAVPLAVPGITDVVGVAASSQTTCVRHSDGTVDCWGANQWGQLGDGSCPNPPKDAYGRPILAKDGRGCTWSEKPHRVPLAGVKQIVAGFDHFCALLGDDTAACWGYSGYGQVGYGGKAEAWRTPIAVGHDTGLLGEIVALEAQGYRACAIVRDNGVWCWGRNYTGESAFTRFSNDYKPHECDLPHTVTDFELGDYHGCAKLADGRVQCFGDNEEGELGDGDQDLTGDPFQAKLPRDLTGDGGRSLTTLAPGNGFTLALDKDQSLVGWGFEGRGLLANGVATDDYKKGILKNPTVSNNGFKFQFVTANAGIGCGYTLDNRIACWGNDHTVDYTKSFDGKLAPGYGLIGDGGRADRLTPSYVNWGNGAPLVAAAVVTSAPEIAAVRDAITNGEHLKTGGIATLYGRFAGSGNTVRIEQSGSTFTVDGTMVGAWYESGGQINAPLPPGLAAGLATFSVSDADGTSAQVNVVVDVGGLQIDAAYDSASSAPPHVGGVLALYGSFSGGDVDTVVIEQSGATFTVGSKSVWWYDSSGQINASLPPELVAGDVRIHVVGSSSVESNTITSTLGAGP